ncbi:MAG: hypothetical protein IKL65_00295 [Bacilli bacterium]|nr:hypothetical protein [Bacilli bacterium]
MIIGPVTETTKKKKKKTLTVTPIKTNKNTNKIVPISKTHAQQYNLDGSKKIAPTVSITTNNISNKGATNLINNTLQQDIKNKTFQVVTGQNKQKIDLSGKNAQSTTPVTKEGLEIQRNQLMTEKELQEKRDKLSDELFNYDREEKVKWWDDDLSFGENLKNVGYKTFLENKNNKYVEDEKYNELKRRFELADNELKNKKVQRESANMNGLDKVGYTITGNVIDSTKGIESTVNKLFGQSTPVQSESFDEMMAKEARKQTTGIAGAGLDIVGSMSKMLPQMIVSGPINSSTAAMAVGFANYGGSAYNEAKQMGATEEQATAYGITIGGLETGLEKLLGGFESVYGKSALGNVTNKIMGKVITNTAFRQVASGMAGEFTEEYLQEFLEPIVRNAILEEENGADFWNAENLEEGVKQFVSQLFNSQNLYAGTLGAVSSGLMSGPSAISQNASINNEVKTIKEDINPKNIEEKISYLTNKGYDTNTSIEIVNKALKETGQSQISTENVVQNETAQETASNTPQISQETGQNQELSNETTNTSQTIETSKNNIKSYTENDINRFSTGNNLIDGVNSDLKSFTEKFYDKETKRAKKKKAPVKSQKMFLGRISDALSTKINSLLNNSGRFSQKYETKDTNIVISSDNIEHIYNHHGSEKMPGQIDVTPENLSKYVDVVSNPDYIGLSSQLSRGNTPTLYFTKKINGYSVAVEVLSTKKQLYPQSYYVFDSNSKEYTDFIKNNKLKKAWDVESGDFKSSDINVQDDTSAAFTDNNVTTKTQKSQVAPVSSQYSMQQNKKIDTETLSKNVIRELENSSFSFKQKQLDIINRTNPADDDVHTWIRTVEDIKTFDEAFFEDGEFSGMDPDFTETMAKNSQGTGKIIVYSSYPIENGVFVSPSKMEASQYAGGDESKLYSKEVDINDVAWIDGAEGQYARVDNNNQLAKKVIAPTIRENNEINESIKDDVIEVSSKDLKSKTKKETTAEDDKIANILKERPVTEEEKDNRLKKLLTVKILDKGYYVDKLARKIKNRELSSKYDYMLSANGVAQQIIGNNKFNPKTQEYKGKGLYKIFEPIENSGKLDDFSQYIYHKHNTSRMNLNSLYSEDNKPVFSSNVTAEDSQKIVDKYEKNNPEFKEWAKEIYDYNNFLLDILVDYEVISKEDKAYYNKKYPYYVPTIRVSDKTKVNLEMIGKKASINIPIKKAKGGNGDIIPLKEAMSLRTMQTLNSALKNNFGNELFDSIETEAINEKMDIDEILSEETDTDEIITKYTKDSPATLTIYKKGEKITFNIPDEIYDALEPSNIKKFKWLNNISKFRRGLITEYNPAFFITNPIKDVQDGVINSKYPSKFAKNIAEAGKQIKEKGKLYQLYLANGGSYETYFNYSDGYNKGPKPRMKYSPMKILDSISSLNEKIEMTPRLAEFISSLESGDTIETAMYNAQEITTNFKRGGVWTKVADANGATFLNAGVQGGLKQIRNIQEAKTNGIKGMTNLAVKFTIAGLTPYILSELIWGDDDDYEELSEYIKNNYYILWKYGDGKFVKIPRGRVTSVIQNLFGQILDTRKGEKIDIKEFIDLLNNQIAPNDPTESNIFSPVINVLENKTWYGTDLVSQRLSKLPSSEQYDESTDSISIWLGKMTGISPVKINYLLDQYSSSIGDIILPFLTLEAENDSNSIVGNLLSPIKSKFATDSVMKSKYPSEFFELDEKLTKKANSSNASDEDILRSKYINSKQYQLNQLYAEKRIIQNDKNLTDTEKYKQVRKKQEEINQLAKEVIETYKDVSINGSTATVNDLKYKKDKDGKWVKQRS